MGKVAASENPILKAAVIHAFKTKYGIDLSIAEQGNALKYKSFNDFFTRALKDGVRLVDENPIVLFHQRMARFLKLVKSLRAKYFKQKAKVSL